MSNIIQSLINPSTNQNTSTMKHIKLIGLMLFAAAIVIYSCKKKDSTDNSTPTPTATMNAKWKVTNADSVSFKSFEFNNSGQYIVVTPNGAKYGNYTKTGSTVAMANFGTITITSLGSTQFNFSLTTLTKGINLTYDITTTKAAEIPLAGNTALLCRTWNLVTVDSVPVAGTQMELQVMFTQAGTYFVHYVQSDTSAMSQWTWKDAQQNWICYNWNGAPTCEGNNEVFMNALTSTRLSMIENELKYELVPYLPVKNSISFSTNRTPANPNRFLGR